METPPDSELLWEYFKSTGPGGQHRNKAETGVKLTHLPSGIQVTATERRSRERNREVALRRLTAKLADLARTVVPRVPTRPGRAARARRLDEKRHQGQKKSLRRSPGLD